MDEDLYLKPFERLLADLVPLDRVRRFEEGEDEATLWEELNKSGYLDAAVPESAGGAGLSMPVVGQILTVIGRHVAPTQIGETMIARALLARTAKEWPKTAIVLATATRAANGYQTGDIPRLASGQFSLIDFGDKIALVEIARSRMTSTGGAEACAGSLSWNARPSATLTIPRPSGGLRPIAALVYAAAIAGAVEVVGRMTIDYARTRKQFGKPIGSYQAIQQQLAVLAEQVVMARAAVQIGFAGAFPPKLAAAAIAKQVASCAAHRVADIAHAVHGAIGISRACDLQLYTRRLHQWRLAEGSETYWSDILGKERLIGDKLTVDFLRSCTR